MNPNVVALAAFAWALASQIAWAEPELNVVKDSAPASIGQPYRITCEVSWVGEPAEFTLLPATIGKVDWAEVTVGAMSSEVRDGANVVSQTVTLVPLKEGSFETPAIEIPFLSPEDVTSPEKPDSPTHPAVPDAHPKLRADPFPLQVQPHTTPAWLTGVLGAFLLFATLGIVAVAIKRRTPVQATIEPALAGDMTGAQEALREAKRRRIEGDYYAYYRELTRAMELGAGHATDAIAELAARAQDAGYRGIRPTDDQMDGDARNVERYLKP